MNNAVQVTMYLNESDKWDQILQLLRHECVATAGAFHAVAGFNGSNPVHTAGLLEAGGVLPVMLVFVDSEERVGLILPKLIKLAPDRLIVRSSVTI